MFPFTRRTNWANWHTFGTPFVLRLWVLFFMETMYTIRDHLYSQKTKRTKSLPEERARDSAYVAADRFNILGGIFGGYR